MMKVLHCPEAEDFEQHVCPSECMCFPKLKRSEYKHHEHDECSMCGARRFTVRQLAGGRRLVPAKVFWYLGMAGTIKDHLFADPKWCDMRATARQTPHDFYSSAEAKRLDKMLGEQLSSPDNSAYELGFDFGQCFAFRQYSVGVLGFRCVLISGRQCLSLPVGVWLVNSVCSHAPYGLLGVSAISSTRLSLKKEVLMAAVY
jgi:hypothetical protein